MRRIIAVLVLVLVAVGCVPEEDKKAADPPTAKRVECRRVTGKLKIDGVLTDAAWKSADGVKDFAVFWEKRKAKTATTAALLWDDHYVYFAAEMEDSDLFAMTRERNGMTWDDDVFEMFFKPHADKPAYYELQV